jgi:PelA/Pel-15E family pectate lyase
VRLSPGTHQHLLLLAVGACGEPRKSQHITYNDGAMVNVLTLLADIVDRQPPLAFVDQRRRARSRAAIARGESCILKTQIVERGRLTVWCAQHDERTLRPAAARSYELP